MGWNKTTRHHQKHRPQCSTLKQLKSSPGPDGLSATVLKSARLEISHIIAVLFNVFIALSFVPSQWKSANITPIPKVDHPKEPNDYRPISLTSNLCKTFERVLSKYTIDTTKDIWINNKQHGFLPGRCTTDAIAKVIDDWGFAKDRKETVFAIFFDSAKAFDLVDHEILLAKLKDKVPPWLISWITQYLTGRKQRVFFNGHETEWKDVEAGVIQGSVLGPILFLIFISDINEYLPKGVEIEKYADDIIAYIIGKQVLTQNLPQDIVDGIQAWCTINKMRLNTTKCKTLVVQGKQPKPAQAVTLNDQPLEEVTCYKYLGIEINNKLDWNQQWERVH